VFVSQTVSLLQLPDELGGHYCDTLIQLSFDPEELMDICDKIIFATSVQQYSLGQPQSMSRNKNSTWQKLTQRLHYWKNLL